MHRMLQVPGHMLRGEREVLVPNRNFLGAKYWRDVYIVDNCVPYCTECCGWCGEILTDEKTTPKVKIVTVAPDPETKMEGQT